MIIITNRQRNIPIPTVYIAGAGPGDPELLTRKTHRLITDYAETIVYDRLIPEAILALIPAHIELIYAGKSCREHVMIQSEINAVLLEKAQAGKRLLRLKGGDPFIFGRGGEEMRFLQAHGIPVEIVPGISAASGAAASLGLPLTHRGVAHSVEFITGHKQKGSDMALDYQALAKTDKTLVFYMGLANLPEITAGLLRAGLPAQTPALAIEWATTAQERSCHGSLETLHAMLEAQHFKPPMLVMIGGVVGL